MADRTKPPEKSAIIKDLESIHDVLKQPGHGQDADEVPLLDDIVTSPEDEAASVLHYARPGLTQDMFSSLLSDAWQKVPRVRSQEPRLTPDMQITLTALTRRWLDDLVVAHIDELHDLIRQTLVDHTIDTTDETPDGQ
ncbi:MAG: hypothetical protein O3A63_18810 [Proteobacteria bacterium]|nr:hypothetical protein [Pseudomonadota bacterium]